MKKYLGIVIASTQLVGALAVASPLIVKSSGGGFVHPEFGGNVRCELYNNKVVITNQYGFQGPSAFSAKEVRSIALSRPLQPIIDLAKTEAIEEKPNNLCDGPSTSVVASPDQDQVLLFTTGGCGSPRKERTGRASSKLRALIDIYCPMTHDFSDPQ